jgi:OFA family oxalate/formate antiporter-like MFS transporter
LFKKGIPNRWEVAAAGVVMQVAFGSIYAWRVFRSPLMHQLHASISAVSLTFTDLTPLFVRFGV